MEIFETGVLILFLLAIAFLLCSPLFFYSSFKKKLEKEEEVSRLRLFGYLVLDLVLVILSLVYAPGIAFFGFFLMAGLLPIVVIVHLQTKTLTKTTKVFSRVLTTLFAPLARVLLLLRYAVLLLVPSYSFIFPANIAQLEELYDVLFSFSLLPTDLPYIVEGVFLLFLVVASPLYLAITSLSYMGLLGSMGMRFMQILGPMKKIMPQAVLRAIEIIILGGFISGTLYILFI